MKKKLYPVILVLVLIALIGIYISQMDSRPSENTINFEGMVSDILLYISTSEIDGKVTRSYAVGIFLDDGTYFRVVGAQEINPGTRYSFTIEPDRYGPTLNELIEIAEIK